MGVSVDLTDSRVENSHGSRGNNDGENREEGEIVDDFEDIISSDEEWSMRKRIEELEARNSELEKLENISGYYNYGKSGLIRKFLYCQGRGSMHTNGIRWRIICSVQFELRPTLTGSCV